MLRQLWTQYQSARELQYSGLTPGLRHNVNDSEAGWVEEEGEGAMVRPLQRQRNLATTSLSQSAGLRWRQEAEQNQAVRSLEISEISVSGQDIWISRLT